jgi:AcrR family transcriptional regulator
MRKKRSAAYHHGDLRQALVAAALRALTHQGAADLSLRAIGRELGVSPRAPYQHFENKEALLAAVAIEGFATFAAVVARHLAAAGPDPLARLRAVSESYVLFAVEQPAAFRVMYAPYATVNESAPDLLRARRDAHQSSMAIIADGQAAGLLRAGDPMEIALVLWSSMHGLAALLIEGQLGRHDRPVQAAKVARLVSRLLLEGLLTRPATRSGKKPRPFCRRGSRGRSAIE